MAVNNYIVDKGYAKNKTLFLFLVLLCFPIIQLGITFYLSVQMLAFILVLFVIPIRIFIKFVPLGFILLGLMCLPIIFAVKSDYVAHDILKTIREFICFALIYCVIKYRSNILKETKVNSNIKKIVPIFLVSFLVITIFQTIYLKNGIYLSIPYEFFMTNYNTLPEALDLKYSHIRPAATFGEPSYLGFVLTSLLVVVLRIYESSWLKSTLIISIVLTVYLSESASGQLAVCILLFIHLLQSKVKPIAKFSLVFVACLGVLIGTVANLTPFERLSNIFDKKKEVSGYARLGAPIALVSQVLLTRPIGVTNSEFGNFIGEKNDPFYSGLANGFYNLLINYGITGFILLILLFLPIWKEWLLIVYIFLSTFFNGGFLAFDKAAIIVASLYMVFYFSAEIKSRAITKNV